jgi:hypothetical protein
VVERYVEGEATEDELDDAVLMAKDAGEDPDVNTDGRCWATQAASDLGGLIESIRWLSLCPKNSCQPLVSKKLLVDTLVDIFGNPFRPVTVDPRWLSETVVALATRIYEERAFAWMPILADALQDAGCEEEQVLMHCREPREHFRGCWVVDMLLGKQ